FFQAEDGIRDATVTGVQTCALPIFGVLVDSGDADGQPVDAAPVALHELVGRVGIVPAQRLYQGSIDILPRARCNAHYRISQRLLLRDTSPSPLTGCLLIRDTVGELL